MVMVMSIAASPPGAANQAQSKSLFFSHELAENCKQAKFQRKGKKEGIV